MSRLGDELEVAAIHFSKLDYDYARRYGHDGKGYKRVNAQVYPEPYAFKEKLICGLMLSIANTFGVYRVKTHEAFYFKVIFDK